MKNSLFPFFKHYVLKLNDISSLLQVHLKPFTSTSYKVDFNSSPQAMVGFFKFLFSLIYYIFAEIRIKGSLDWSNKTENRVQKR